MMMMTRIYVRLHTTINQKINKGGGGGGGGGGGDFIIGIIL